jgi:tetratricopeptide (TPR) repeat protein
MCLVLLLAMFASAVQAQPRADRASAEAAYRQGLAAEKENDLNAARSGYESAVRLDPSMAVAHDRLGFVLARHARAHYQLGLALERIGARAEAQAHFADSERLAPYLTTAAKPATPQAKTPIKK